MKLKLGGTNGEPFLVVIDKMCLYICHLQKNLERNSPPPTLCVMQQLFQRQKINFCLDFGDELGILRLQRYPARPQQNVEFRARIPQVLRTSVLYAAFGFVDAHRSTDSHRQDPKLVTYESWSRSS